MVNLDLGHDCALHGGRNVKFYSRNNLSLSIYTTLVTHLIVISHM